MGLLDWLLPWRSTETNDVSEDASLLTADELEPRSVVTLDEDKIVYKATREGIAKLRLPKGTGVVVPHSEARLDEYRTCSVKLRADGAIVESLYEIATDNRTDVLSRTHIRDMHHSIHDHAFVYREGEMVEPRKFEKDIYEKCAGGIHFFMTESEAAEWYEAFA